MAEILSEFGHLVGLTGGNNIQATTMPTYSSVPLGTIVQYIGTTTADYINGYFYKATATGWEQHDTQPASNADNSITAFKESSPTLAAHAVDEYIRYNNVTYIVTAAIAIGDTLTIGTNIAVPTLDEGTVIYTPETGGSINGVVDVLVDGQSVVDENGEAHINTPNAGGIGYDNTESELEATNTQDAIDEVVDIVADKVDKVTGKGLSANDYTDTDKAKVGKIDETTTSASGNPISISGLKSNQLAINPVITLEPIQAGSGDPSPSNVRAISGYDKIEVLSCGKNLIDCPDTSISTSAYVIHHYDCEMVKSSGYHVFSFNFHGTTTEAEIQFFTSDSSAVADVTFTLVEGLNTVSINLNGKQSYINFFSNGVGDYTNFQLEANPNFTSYEPYHKTTDLSLQIGQTIYGGTLDLEKGVLTVNRGYDSYKWSDGISVIEYTYCIVKRYDLSNHTVINPSTGWGDESITNIVTYDHNFYHDIPHYYIQNGYDLVVFLAKEASADTDIQVAYKLETPYTIQLTPHEISLLKDYAYVSTNGTNMSLSYKNGEIASLGDVSQLGQTVNALGDMLEIIPFSVQTGNFGEALIPTSDMILTIYCTNVDNVVGLPYYLNNTFNRAHFYSFTTGNKYANETVTGIAIVYKR